MVNANSGSPTTAAVYNGALTREQFLFHEMRTTAKLLQDGLSEAEAIQKIVAENLFQYPTERQIRNMARVCISSVFCFRTKIFWRERG